MPSVPWQSWHCSAYSVWPRLISPTTTPLLELDELLELELDELLELELDELLELDDELLELLEASPLSPPPQPVIAATAKDSIATDAILRMALPHIFFSFL